MKHLYPLLGKFHGENFFKIIFLAFENDIGGGAEIYVEYLFWFGLGGGLIVKKSYFFTEKKIYFSIPLYEYKLEWPFADIKI